MNKEVFEKEFLIPELNIPFEATFRKKEPINDIKNILIMHFLYSVDRFKNYTVAEFIREITNIKTPKLLDFVLMEFINLIETNVILTNFEKIPTIEEIKEFYISQFGVDKKIIHPEIEQAFNKNNFVGLESKLKEKNMFYQKNLLTLKEKLSVKEKQYKQNENYEFLDPYKILEKPYGAIMGSIIKEYFKNNKEENLVFIDYKLQDKNKSGTIDKEYIKWCGQMLSFTLENNEINTDDKETREYLKTIKVLQLDDQVKHSLNMENIVDYLLELPKIEETKNKMENILENNSENIFSKNFNNEIINWKQSEREIQLFSLFNKWIKIKNEETFLVNLSKFQIKFYKFSKEIEAFSKQIIDLEKLFKEQEINLEDKEYDSFIVEMLFKNCQRIIKNKNFSYWFNKNFKKINLINYSQAKEIIAVLNDNSNKIMDILLKTPEFKAKNIQNISQDLFTFLNEMHFSDWGTLNDKLKFKYDQNSYLFDKKWKPETTIELFYQKLEELEKFKSNIEDIDLSKEEYLNKANNLDELQKFFNSFIENISPIKKDQITGYQLFNKYLLDIKKILDNSSREYKKSELHKMRIEIEKKVGLKGEDKHINLSKKLEEFTDKKAVSELQKIIKEYLNPASHASSENKEFKQKIDNLNFQGLEELQKNIEELLKKLKK
ncbi:hypothetical protein [Mycoplasma zalophi]|uniref:hypothetical protein n=1 Tax=Mycoplasma zalophi TaxID=191287 RepID=UPI001C1222BB|nr:hypothetical protein [Mycoplasma zalophi]MBU4691109.1 hypothetical protein [Mycoplasma zalophi]